MDLGVSKGNFLLTSSANDSEIATFIATVRKILIDVSPFYTPEEPLKPIIPPKKATPEKKRPHPLSSKFSPFPKTGLQSPTLPSPSSTRPESIAETFKTSKSLKSRAGRSMKSKKRFNDDVSIMTFDPADDSDYDMEERRLMPIFMQKPSRKPKPNSRKALKFLGLA
jgi:hypothetical protein